MFAPYACMCRSSTQAAAGRRIQGISFGEGLRGPRQHLVSSSAVFGGSRCTSNLTLLWLTRSILHDDNVYPDPDIFDPDRFLKNGKLNPDILDSESVGFGFGRRICPGKYMAYNTLWITIATVLACAEICPAKDAVGRDIEVTADFVSSFIT